MQSRPIAEPLGIPQPRRIGLVNWRGLWTLYLKEVRRFLTVYTQTLLAPMVTTLLFLAIFTLALGRSAAVEGIGYAEFLVPGLVMMAILQNAFANTSASIVISKVQGNIVDLLMPPLAPAELAIGIVGGGITRGLLVGLVVLVAMRLFVPFGLHDPLLMLYHAVSASVMLSLLGTLGGIWAEKFDQMAAVTNFVITPLSFLSGTFYSIQRLPEAWQQVALFNPFLYLIDGFRYGVIGHADTSLALGMAVVLLVNLALLALVLRLLAIGYRIKP